VENVGRKIVISGKIGAGKSVIRRKLQEKLNQQGYNFRAIGMGDTVFRKFALEYANEARKRGMEIEEGQEVAVFTAVCRQNSEYDKMMDKYLTELGQNEEDMIIDARRGCEFIPHAFKIFLDIDLDEAARRRFNDKSGTGEAYSSFEIAKTEVKKREDSQDDRYRAPDGSLPYKDFDNYNVVLSTTHVPLERVDEAIDYIIAAKKQFEKNPNYQIILLSPKELIVVDRGVKEKFEFLNGKLPVIQKGDRFYVDSKYEPVIRRAIEQDILLLESEITEKDKVNQINHNMKKEMNH